MAYDGAHDKAWVVTVLMGLGHLRAAYPLRGNDPGKIIVYGARNTPPPGEYRLWRSIRRFYYGSSRAGSIPLSARPWSIFSGHPADSSAITPRPISPIRTPASGISSGFIKRRNLCRGLRRRLGEAPVPVAHTFFATAIALDGIEADEADPKETITW